MATDGKMNQQRIAKLNEQFQKIWQLPQVQALLPRMPRYRYWQVKGDHYAYCYTTESTSDKKFYAMVYRITKKSWKLTRRVAFGRRKIAKARAYHWYCERKEKLKKP